MTMSGTLQLAAVPQDESISTDGANGDDTGTAEQSPLQTTLQNRERGGDEEKSQREALVKGLKRPGDIYHLRLSKR